MVDKDVKEENREGRGKTLQPFAHTNLLHHPDHDNRTQRNSHRYGEQHINTEIQRIREAHTEEERDTHRKTEHPATHTHI